MRSRFIAATIKTNRDRASNNPEFIEFLKKWDDYSTIWRNHLDHSSHYETLDDAVSALVGAIKTLSAQDTDYTRAILTSLKPFTWPIFDRLRAFTCLSLGTSRAPRECREEASRYASYALNTPRPVGVEAMIRYGRWIKLATPEAEFTPALLAPVFEVLEQKLDAGQEPSAAVREMFGMQFRTLAWLDLDWFMSVIPKLFPGKDGKLKDERMLDRFAWTAYLQYGGPVRDTVPAVRKRYLLAVRALQKGEDSVRELDRTLAGHLMQYYAHGAIELDDPLVTQFFESASVKLRGQAVGDIGWSLGHETAPLSPEMLARLMRLWESRMFLLGAGSKDDADELATFGWWMSSGKSPDEWVIGQTMPILELLRSLRPDFAVVESLDRLSSKYPYEAVRVVRVLFEDDRDGWAIHGWNQHLDSILKKALNDGDSARAEAQQMIELLVSKGFRGYRSLLGSDRSSA